MNEGRHEMKYAISLEQRREVLQFAREHISPDPHGVDLSPDLPEVRTDTSESPRGYRVSSLYFDDERFTGYTRRIDGRRIRNRIRIRSYGDPGVNAPVFLEAKRKLHKQVVKHRVKVTDTRSWSRLPPAAPWNHLPEPSVSLDRDRMLRWQAAVNEKQLEPVCRVEYWRETFARGSLRLTLDHRIGGYATADAQALRGDCPTRLVPDGWVVLELKYNGQPPPWMRRLVAQFRLVAEPISKFALGVALTCRAHSPSDRRAATPPSIQRAWRLNRAAK